MERIDWITKLSEKKPSPALVAALLIAIASLSSVIVWQNTAMAGIRSECEAKIIQERSAFKAEYAEQKKDLVDCQNENREWASNYIKRIDAESEKREKEYEKRINRFESLEAKQALCLFFQAPYPASSMRRFAFCQG